MKWSFHDVFFWQMFIVQPHSIFADLICHELTSAPTGRRRWDVFEFAVAWLNAAGAESLLDAARDFLAAGGRIRATIGLDFGSTTYEGLESLLALEDRLPGITTHVFCDENSACTFHPKVFIFSDSGQALLIVGSNNMTGAGLATNLEAALSFTGAIHDETIRSALDTLAAWRDERSETRSKRLTRELLSLLRDRRYVLTEEELRSRRQAERSTRSSAGEPLFGRSTTSLRRSVGRAGSTSRTESASGEALLMRVLKRRNGNQIQISIPLLNSTFMNGATEVVLADGSRRRIGANAARGGPNTERFEAPGLKNMAKPVARFRWASVPGSKGRTERQLHFELFDADAGGEGADILQELEEGISAPPVTNMSQLSRHITVLSKADPDHAQWYRLIP